MLRIYKWTVFLTLHVKNMWWEVNAHLIFYLFLYFFQKSILNSVFADMISANLQPGSCAEDHCDK